MAMDYVEGLHLETLSRHETPHPTASTVGYQAEISTTGYSRSAMVAMRR
jgi:hypothetical protein